MAKATRLFQAAGALLLTFPAYSADAPRFVEETRQAGIEHVYDGEWEFFVGGGVAIFDCDGDRLPDVFLAGGSKPAALYRNVSSVGGALRFTDASSPTVALDHVTGGYPIDIDGDAIIDLVVLRLGENIALRGLGGCGFERANERWGIDGGNDWTTAFSARWEVSGALPTLAFGNYIDRDQPGSPFGTCANNVLIRPAVDGLRYAAPTILNPSWCTLSLLFTDWNRVGNGDLRVSNDRQYYRSGEEQLWHISPGDPPRQYSREEGWERLQIWGMGIASHDLNGDGYPEIFLTSMGDNKLQTLDIRARADEAHPVYRNISLASGVTAQRPYAGGDVLPSTAWHAEFGDVNNDGFADLFIAKGNVDAMVEAAARDPNNLLIGRPDGTFEEKGLEAGVGSFARARGAALADFNLDGMLDLIVVNRRENIGLWRNTGRAGKPQGNWIALWLEQPSANRWAVGSWLEIGVGDRILHREITIGGGHAGGKLGWLHFGLGDQEGASFRVQWPNGETGPWVDIAANSFVLIARGEPEARIWSSDRARP